MKLLVAALRVEAGTIEDIGNRSRNLDIMAAEALGHMAAWMAARFTGESHAAITWAAPHPYAGMTEPLPDFSSLLDPTRLLIPKQYTWSLGQNVHHRTWLSQISEVRDGAPLVVAEGKHDTICTLALLAAVLRLHHWIANQNGS